MCIASLRQLDALRSHVPCFALVEGIPAFHSVAAYTKGHNTRARQRPMPWWVPAASVEPSITDADAANALQRAFSDLEISAPSMFTEVVGPDGRACSLATAARFGSNRARPEHLTSSLAFLFTWSPLSYPADRAKAVAAGRHGPRHVLPEVARVMGMPAAARDELGRWKDGGGRLQRHSNRYSREGERLMQLTLRMRLVHRIRAVIADSSLRGKGRFCLSPVFGRMGVAILSTLRRRQYVDRSSDMTTDLAESLRALRAAVRLFPNFTVPLQRDVRPPVVVLSDASWEVGHTWIGFVVLCPFSGVRWAGMPTPSWLLDWLSRLRAKQTYIGQLELAAALTPYRSLPPGVFRGRAVSHYIDNQGALYSMIHGRSSDADSNRLVFLARLRMHVLRADVWFDYVPSASNIADLPTRLDCAAQRRLAAIGPRVPCVLPDAGVLCADWESLIVQLLEGLSFL